MSAIKPGLAGASFDDGLLQLRWSDANSSSYHPIWLRDNCRCETCGDPAIGRRNLRLSRIDLDPKPVALEATAAQLDISWQDGHQSSYSSEWLRENAYDDEARASRAFKPRLWDRLFREQPPIFQYAQVDNDDDQLLQVLKQVRDLGLCFIRNAPAEAGIIEAFASRIGFPQESNFGRIQDLTVDHGKRSIGNDVQALKPHTDEPYRASPPGILLFHCVTTDINGTGCSTFVDGFEIAEILRDSDPEGFEALCRNRQPFRRHFQNDVDVIAEFPTITLDEFGNLGGIRLNDRVAAPLSIAPAQMQTYYRGMRQLLELSEDPAHSLQLTLQPGDIAIFDNHRVLHGRTRLTLDGKRWLQWVQIERGDFHSSLRIIADRLKLERDANPLLRGAYG